MADLSTSYLGLPLKTPIIVGSCGLTNSVDKVKELEESGAGAVVLKSIFEEEIAIEYEALLQEVTAKGYDPDEFEYYDQQIKGEKLGAYKALISDCKRAVSIPVIASVNCMYSFEWATFARELEAAGADALELNIFFMPSSMDRTSQEQEQLYFDAVARVQEQISIPVTLKMGTMFTNLGGMIQKLADTGDQ